MNLSQSQYSRIENADSGLDKERLKQIAEILKIDIAQLIPLVENNAKGFESLYDKLKVYEQESHILNFQVGAALDKVILYEKLFNFIFESANKSDSFEDFKNNLVMLNTSTMR